MTLVLALLLALGPDGPEALRQQGVTLLAEGDTLGAVASFEAAVSDGWTNSEVLLSIGRAHLERGEVGEAIVSLERASRLSPDDAGIASARREAYAMAGQVAPAIPPPFIASRTVVRLLGAGVLVALALVLYLATVTLGVAWWRTRRRALGWSAVAVAPIAVAALVLAGLALWDAGAPRGVVLATVEVRAHPSPEAETVGRVREGEVLASDPSADGWRRVEVGDVTGWVPERTIETL